MSPQELQRRVRADDEQLELLRQIARDQAVMRGQLERLLIRQNKSLKEADRVALNVLVEAAYRAMGVRVWIVAELLSRGSRTFRADWCALA
jgi:sporulation-control protein spo0M